MALSQAKREEAVKQIAHGKTVYEVATALGTSPSQIRWAVKGTEVAAQAKADRQSRLRFSAEIAKQIIDKYLTGVGSTTLAVEYGVGHATIVRLLQRNGVERRKGWAKDPEERKCSKCLVVKPMGAFGHAHTRPEWKFRTYVCRECASERHRAAGWNLKGNTGITLAQYNELLTEQGGGCAICGKPPVKIRLSVDHDHETLRIRGLLCHGCNTKLVGREDAEFGRKADAYLEAPPASGRGWVFTNGRNSA
jgi:hypothetical protein